jgi:hypothetical protein
MFEYKELRPSSNDVDLELNKLGAQGWRLVAVVARPSGGGLSEMVYVMERNTVASLPAGGDNIIVKR